VTFFLFVSLVFVGTQVVLPGDFVSQYALFLSTSESEEMRQTLGLALLAPAPLVMVVIGFMLDVQPLEFGLLYGILAGLGTVGVVLRSHALSVMSKPFIEALRVAGGGAVHIIFGHLIPHRLPLAAVNMMLVVTGAIFANGFIGFLGLSRAQLNWGTMIYNAFTYMGINETIAWNVLLASASAISLFAAAFYLVAGGLHDVADPRQRK